MLLWFARLNAIGIAFTIVEVLYLLLKDDALQNWLDQCTFRKRKTHVKLTNVVSDPHGIMVEYDTKDVPSPSFPTLERELAILEEAFAEITGAPVESKKAPVDDTRTQEEILNDPRNMIY